MSPLFASQRGVRIGSGRRVLSFLFVFFVLGCTVLIFVARFREATFDGGRASGWVAQLVNHEAEPTLERELPVPTGLSQHHFEWTYHGKNYAFDTAFYASTYQFYRALPAGVPLGASGVQDREWWAALNTLFMTPAKGDETIAHIAQSIRSAGEHARLSDDQMVELVASFVQSIPYDQAKTDRRASGQDGVTEKITYPYEVLYEEKGVCQDKSYLAYALLHELGYGVALFLFPDPKDNHMAVGVACPAEYANYDSGYCFLETTGKGNIIGIIPSLIPKSRVATADIELKSDVNGIAEDAYQPLGRVEVLNALPGKEYAGIVNTVKTRDTLAKWKAEVDGEVQELETRGKVIADEKETLQSLKKTLDTLKRQERYEAYNDEVKSYNKLVDTLKRHIEEYNALVEKSRVLVKRYNALNKSLYEG